MKRKLFLRTLVVFYLLTGGTSSLFGGQKSNGNSIITLDLLSPTSPPSMELNAKGYWKETYNTAEQYHWFEFGLFKFSHVLSGFGGGDVGGGMSYWDGFTYCTSGDTIDYGEFGDSNGWVAEQWGCMPGGGIKTDADGNVLTDANGKVLVQQGNPYLVAYWGYYQEVFNNGIPCLQIQFSDGNQYQVQGLYIANHPWPYYGNIHGDGFARSFEEGDYFKLIAHGLNEMGEDIGIEIEHILAEFTNGSLVQSSDWEWMDLSPLGTVSGIYFTMETTDSDPIYGPNTAVYFCLDKLQVLLPENSTMPTRPTGLTTTADETNINFSWTASTGSNGVKGYNIYLDGLFKAFTTTTQYAFSGLPAYTQYKLGVEAVSNDDKASPRASLNASTTDETAPTAPVDLEGTTTDYTMSLSWSAATDNVAVTEYHIYLNGERQKKVSGTVLSYTLTGLDEDTDFLVEVEARDAAGNRSDRASIRLSTKKTDTATDLTEASSINIYPRLAPNTLNIETPVRASLEIYNQQGIKLVSEILSSGSNRIDISHLPKGIYIVKCNNIIKKIIK